MLITTTRLDDGWRKSLRWEDDEAIVAVYRAEMKDGTHHIVAQVAEPKLLRPTASRATFLDVPDPRMVGTPDLYVASVAGGLVAMRRWAHLSLEDAAAACVACVGNVREPVTYVAIAGELVRVWVRIERGYDRERRKVLECPVFAPAVLLSAAAALPRAFVGSMGGSVRLVAFAVDGAAFAARAHCPAYIAGVVARVYSLVDWEFARVYQLPGALLLEAYEYDIPRVRAAVARVSAAQIELESGPLRRAATVSAATLDTYEEGGTAVDEWLDILAQGLAAQQSRGGDGVEISSWGWPDPTAPRSPN